MVIMILVITLHYSEAPDASDSVTSHLSWPHNLFPLPAGFSHLIPPNLKVSVPKQNLSSVFLPQPLAFYILCLSSQTLRVFQSHPLEFLELSFSSFFSLSSQIPLVPKVFLLIPSPLWRVSETPPLFPALFWLSSLCLVLMNSVPFCRWLLRRFFQNLNCTYLLLASSRSAKFLQLFFWWSGFDLDSSLTFYRLPTRVLVLSDLSVVLCLCPSL